MKSKTIMLFGMLLLLGCSADAYDAENSSLSNAAATGKKSPNVPKNTTPPNKVLLLKVDFLTQTFEGGKQLVFTPNSGFSIAADYQPPMDFGGISLKYAELNQAIFEGTIHWMGLGQMQYPGNLDSAMSFATTLTPLPIPNATLLATVAYDQYAYYPNPMPWNSIWNAVDNLVVVKQYRNSNPNSTVNVFLYTPSVGVGNPADWDYFVILKN